MIYKEKKYSNGEVTVIWKSEVCIHSANCVNNLISVFNPDKKPWINMEGASTEEIIKVVSHCPSGALNYERENNMAEEKKHADNLFEIKVNTGGPYLVKGPVKLVDNDGKEIVKDGTIALCRCGGSSNKPFCDGSHKQITFDT